MLKTINKMLEEAVQNGVFPGCNFAIVKKDGTRYMTSVGLKAKYPEEEANDLSTIYDMASCSKVVSTTTCIMFLLERGLLRLNDSVSFYLPEFSHPEVTIWDLLTHTSGMRPGLPGSHNMNREQIIDGIMKIEYDYPRHSQIKYSDLNFVLLGLIVEKISGMGLDEFATENLFKPLEMVDSGYNPKDTSRCATTEYREHLKAYDRGYVHDEMAHNLGGVAGHAGFFSTVSDLSNFIEMFLNDGVFRGKRILSKRTIDLFSKPQVRNLDGNGLEGEARGLGWITKCNNTNAGDLCSDRVICHTGFTGTNIVIDRANGFGYTLLSNRVHPTRANNKVIRFRSLLANFMYAHLEDVLAEVRWIDNMKYKYVKEFDRTSYVNYYGSKELVKIPEVYEQKKKESRGVWFSTVENIDLIPTDNTEKGIKEAKKNIKDVIKTCKKYHLNTIVLQVRPTNDALYKSKLNPYSKYLNKERKEGQDPGYDFLACYLEEAKKAKIDIHAWMNPYRVTNSDITKWGGKDGYLATLDDNNFAKKNPELVLETKLHHLILDPASEVVQDFIKDTVMEIAQNYDVQGFHIDDYFYPYDPIIDDKEEEKHQKIAPELSLDDFRRHNVNMMIKKIHNALATLDKHIDFGISPFAVYRTNSKWYKKEGKEGGWDKGSDNMPGALQGYEAPLYSDVIKWMEEGWIDYVTPQCYWGFDNYRESEDGKRTDVVKYADIVKWWSERARETNTKLFIGMAIYRASDSGVWSNDEMIADELRYNQNFDNISGFTMFTYHSFTTNKNVCFERMRQNYLATITKDSKPL